MNYTWRIFKYSKLIDSQTDKLSHCKSNIEPVSQSIIHSQVDSQGIRKEQWLHIFMESNRFIEITMSNFNMEITLNIHNPPNIKITKLESLTSYKNIKVCLKGRVLAFKFNDIKKKFQITFFNVEEASVFFNKFNALICIYKEDEIETIHNRKLFLDLFYGEHIPKDIINQMRTTKSQKELVKEFLNLIKD